MTEGPRGQEKHPNDDDFGLNALREVLRLISDTDITELQIERGGAKLHIKRGHLAHASAPYVVAPHAPPTMAMPAHHPSSAAGQSGNASAPIQREPELPSGHIVTAPMVGTFYAAASPKDPPYVREGDEIQPGDRVGIIEAMKMMNEIESEVAGRIGRILVENGQPVEYGQPLMTIAPL